MGISKKVYSMCYIMIQEHDIKIEACLLVQYPEKNFAAFPCMV